METSWSKDGQYLSKTTVKATTMNRNAHRTVRNLTILTDFILINVGWVLGYLVRYRYDALWEWVRDPIEQYNHSFLAYLPQQIVLNLFLAAIFYKARTWWRRRGEFWLDEVYRIGYCTAVAFVAMMAYQYVIRPDANSRGMIFLAGTFISALIGASRLVRRILLQRGYKSGKWADRVLVIGSGETGRGVIRTLLARPDLGFKAIGFLNHGNDTLGTRRIPHLGNTDELEQVLKEKNLHTVFIALPASEHSSILQLTKTCLDNDIRAQIVPDLFQLSLGRVEMNNMGGIPVLGVQEVYTSKISQFIKRIIDLIIVAIFAIPALLVTLFVVIAIKLDDGGPVFYQATRVGVGGKPFHMYKFRSMVLNADELRKQMWEQNEAEGAVFKIKDDPRVTKIGKLIRKLSLDELPQFYNILKGDMSFVGPRPPILDEVEQYDEWHHRRLEVKGGLTGLWQVSGRSDLTFDEQCLLDIYYMENWSLALDFRIALQTVPYILFGGGGAY